MDKAGLTALASGPGPNSQIDRGRGTQSPGSLPALPWSKVVVSAEPPSLEDNRNDVARLLAALRKAAGEHSFVFDFEAIRDLPDAWRDGQWTVTTTINAPGGPLKRAATT